LNQTPVFLLIENWNTGACTLYDDDDDIVVVVVVPTQHIID
jgi:hypothetical protein